MRTKKFYIIIIVLFMISVTLSSCTKSNDNNNNNKIPTSQITDTNDNNNNDNKSVKKITPDEAISILVNKKGFKKEDLEYSGIDQDTGDHMVTLSPKQSKGAAGRTFFINSITGEIK